MAFPTLNDRDAYNDNIQRRKNLSQCWKYHALKDMSGDTILSMYDVIVLLGNEISIFHSFLFLLMM